MRIGVFGTGIVGRTLGGKLVELGHEVRMGSRTADNERAAEWAAQAGPMASHGTFADAAGFAELAINATNGDGAVPAVESARQKLAGKLLIDVSNPLDFSHGFPPRLSVCNDDSLGERVHRALPDTRVVKALNTVNCVVMVDPAGCLATMWCSCAARTRRPSGRRSTCSAASVGRPSGWSTWAVSRPRAAPRRTCCCGCG